MPKLIDISNTLKQTGDDFVKVVSENIRKAYPINDYIRANADTMRVEASEQGLIIWGGQYFENVETGIPPIAGKGSYKFANVRGKLFDWSIRAGIQFDTESQRRSFAFLLRRKIFNEGTALYRAGGRKDIYTPEIDGMIEKISNAFVTAIVNTRLT